MKTKLIAFFIAFVASLALAQFSGLPTAAGGTSTSLLSDGGVNLGPISALTCGTGFTCSVVGKTGTISPDLNQTYAALTLYVDPTGNDANACTASGASACVTVNGALAKVPRFVNHDVTVHIAAGTYAGSVTVQGFIFSQAGRLNVIGDTWTNTTLATGTATGSITTYTVPTTQPAVLGSLTSAGQTWTAGDLKGHFLTMTSGAAIGTHRVIVGNTTTSIELNTIAALTVGDTYAIQDPAAVLTNSVLIFGVTGSSTRTAIGLVTLDSLTITGTGPSVGQGLLDVRQAYLGDPVGTSSTAVGVYLRNLRVIGTGVNRYTVNFTNANVSTAATAPSYFANNTVSTFSVLRSGLGASFVDQGSYVRQESASASVTGAAVSVNSTGLSAGSTAAFPVYEAGSGATSTSAAALEISASFNAHGSNFWLLSGVLRAVSGYGISASSDTMLTITCGSVTAVHGMSIGTGAHVIGSTASCLLFPGATDEITLDGTAYTFAQIYGFSPRRVQGNSGSFFDIR